MTALRAPLTEALTTGLAGRYDVVGYPTARYTRPTVAVWTTGITRLPAAPVGAYELTHTVLIITGQDTASGADAALEPALLDVLEVLWRAPQFLVDSATRTVSDDETTHSWTLTVRGVLKIEEN